MIDCTINKNIEIGTKISFILGSRLLDGTITEKSYIDKGDIGFIIKTGDNKYVRIKHRYLDIYHIYK